MPTDELRRAYAALDAKKSPYSRLWDYYRGIHPLVYTNKRLEEIFRDLDARFTENWCAIVVDAVDDRIELSGLGAKDESAQEALSRIWAATNLDLDAMDAHRAALVCGEAFLIVWPDEQGMVQCYYNDPRLCHVFYDAENPKQISWAAKWWDDDESKRHITLYFPDRLEYYTSTNKAENVTSANSFEPADPPTAPNPYGRVPVFHLRTGPTPVSELANVIPIQNGINKLLIDMMVAAEYGAFRQRWIISNADVQGKLRNSPNEIWSIPAGDGLGQQTQVGEFAPTDLSNYLTAIDNLSRALGIITRTPRHYFFAQGGDPSGEALISMEAPLNKKVSKLIRRFTPVWQEVGQFLLELDSNITLDPDDVTPMFAEPASIQPLTQAQVRSLSVSAGIPLITALRREGWMDAELAQLAEDQAEETVTSEKLGEQLLTAFERGQ